MIRSAAMGFTTWIPSPVENHSVSFWKMYSHQRGWSAHTHTQHCKKNSAQATAELHSAQAAVSLPLAERNTSQLGTTGPPRQGDHMEKSVKIHRLAMMDPPRHPEAILDQPFKDLQHSGTNDHTVGSASLATLSHERNPVSEGFPRGPHQPLSRVHQRLEVFLKSQSLEADLFTGDIFSDPIVKSDSHLQTQLLIVPYRITGRIMPMYYIPNDLIVTQQLWFARSPVTMNGAPFWLRKCLVSSPTSPPLELSTQRIEEHWWPWNFAGGSLMKLLTYSELKVQLKQISTNPARKSLTPSSKSTNESSKESLSFWKSLGAPTIRPIRWDAWLT